MKRWLIAVVVIVVVAVGVGAFFGGRATGGGGTPSPQAAMNVLQNLTQQQRQQLFQNGGLGSLFGGGRGTARANGGFTAGTVLSKDSGSITVKMSDGSTKIVLYSGSTTIGVSKTGSAADLATGKEVTVTGTTNSDGSVTATRIQVGNLPRPAAGAGSAPGTSTTAVGGGA